MKTKKPQFKGFFVDFYSQTVATGSSALYPSVGRLDDCIVRDPTSAIQTLELAFRSPKIIDSFGFEELQE